MDYAGDNRLVNVQLGGSTEWIWYYMDKGTWKPYSGYLNDRIEDARKLGASVVQFSIGATYYELNFETERQQNLSTHFIRTVKKLGPGEDPNVQSILPKEKKYKWYWMDQDWTAYPDHLNKMFEAARRDGRSQVHFTAGNGRRVSSYYLDLDTMRQRNLATQFSRVVKMMEVSPENPFIDWQYHGDAGWSSYDAESKRKLEGEYNIYLIDGRLSSTTLTNPKKGFSYSVDFATMSQTNLSTHRRRNIRRKANAQKVASTQSITYVPVSGKGEWVYANDHGGFNAYSSRDQKTIEEAYQNGETWVRLRSSGREYVLVFNEMVQVNMRTRFERVIRRQADAADPVVDLVSSNLSALALSNDTSAIDDKNLCKVCMDGEVRVAVLPCAHTYLCVDCAGMNGGVKSCAICRENVDRTICLFFS